MRTPIAQLAHDLSTRRIMVRYDQLSERITKQQRKDAEKDIDQKLDQLVLEHGHEAYDVIDCRQQPRFNKSLKIWQKNGVTGDSDAEKPQ